MLTSLDSIENGFKETATVTKEKCRDDLEKIRQLIFTCHYFTQPLARIMKPNEKTYEKSSHSLVIVSFMELIRMSGHILFLSMNGLYRNAFDSIRYILERLIQSSYLDSRHPEVPLRVKIEILKEIEDKREYHSSRLIEELKSPNKDKLKKVYKELSRSIHPSSRQVIETVLAVKMAEGTPTRVDRGEILRIYNSMIAVYDVFFFLLLQHFPEMLPALKSSPKVKTSLKMYDFPLVSDVLKDTKT